MALGKSQFEKETGIQSVEVASMGMVPVLSADLNTGKKHVIVSESVLNYLVGLLPKARLHEIKEAFIQKVMHTGTIEDYASVLQEELDFHASVNLIRKYYGVEVEQEPQAVSGV